MDPQYLSIKSIIFVMVYTFSVLNSLGAASELCWCNNLGRKISQSTNFLFQRYGKYNLNQSSLVWSSGKSNGLANRIYRHLNEQTPLRMGIVGGSFSSPGNRDKNTWWANVTRWVNMMMSSSKCDSESRLLISNSTMCPGEPIPIPCLNKTLISHSDHETPLFCHPFLSDAVSASFHQGNRPLAHICSTAHHNESRLCSVYIGSGKYAQISSGAKGNSDTRYGDRHISRILEANENLDFLFWDFSRNDPGLIQNTLAFMLRFIPHALKSHKNLVGLGIVYWMNTEFPQENQKICYPHFENISNDISELHFPFLVKYFDPEHGPYRNLSLVTMSQGLFCRNVGCVKQDFLDLDTNHPSPMGLSRFADLVIWQFLKVFRRVHRHHCNDKSLHTNTSHFSWFTSNSSNPNTKFSSEFAKNAADVINRFLEYPVDATSGRLSFHPDYPVEDITVVASMPFSSPVIGKPLPVEQAAILCTPGIPVEFGRRLVIAHQSVEANITGPLRWVEMEITTVLREACAGWAERHFPTATRHDADHQYRPAATNSCWDCPAPDWAGSDYPHGYWSEMPMVKKVDIVIRLSSKLTWTHVCFNGCKPRFLWQVKGVWKEGLDVIDFRSNVKDWVWREPYSCGRKTSHPDADYHFLWYEAKTCFPPLNVTLEGTNIWNAPEFNGEIGFIRVD